MSSQSSGIFTPATRLLQNMPIARKFLLIILAFIIPLGYMSWNSVSEKQQTITFFQHQREGIEKLQLAYDTLQDILFLREFEYSNTFGFNDEITNPADTKEKIDRGIKQLLKRGSAGTQQRLTEVNTLWKQLKDSDAEALDKHNSFTQLSLSLRIYMQRLAEDYDVLLGHDLNAYQLSHITTDTLVYSIDLVSAMRGLSSGIISRGTYTPDSFIKLSYYTGELEATLQRLRHAYKASAQSRMDDSLYKEAEGVLAESQSFLTTTKNMVIEPDRFLISAYVYNHTAIRVLNSLKKLHIETKASLVKRYQTSISEAAWKRNEVIIISVAITLIMLYLFTGFYLAMKQGIYQINTTLAAVAQGNLKQKADVAGKDEIRNIADNLNRMTDQIRKLIKLAYSK